MVLIALNNKLITTKLLIGNHSKLDTLSINMHRSQLWISITILLLTFIEIMELKNLIQIESQPNEAIVESANQSTVTRPSTIPLITYNSCKLRRLRLTCKHDNRYKIMPFGAIRTIRENNINKRTRKSRGKIRPRSAPTQLVLIITT